MIKINLLGQKPPKPARRAVPAGLGTTLMLLVAGVAVAGVVLFAFWKTDQDELKKAQDEITSLTAQKTTLAPLEEELKKLEQQEADLQRKRGLIDVIERSKIGGRELLETVAGTVVRTETLWLTLMTRKGDALTMEGSAGSLQAVANFITQLKRSGYFEQVEIKETRQDERSGAAALFVFSITAQFRPPAAAGAAPGKAGD
jgi:Tfp pilus assembly protein PilN